MPDATALTMADVLGKKGPALSATSDMPVATPAPPPNNDPPPPAAVGVPTPKGSKDFPEGYVPDEADVALSKLSQEERQDLLDKVRKAADAKATDETPAWMKAEITKERNRRRDAENRVAEAERKAAEAAARLDEALKRIPAPAPADAPAPAPADPRPQRDAFEDPQAYDDALIEWSTRQATAKAREDAAETERVAAEAKAEAARREAEATQITAIQTKWSETRAKAIERMPDYEAVAESPELQISMAMAAVITTRDNGPDIAYHLGKHPEEAARLAALSPPQAVFEMGLLAAQLQTTAKPQITSAPDPVKPVGARSSAVPKGPDEESMDEYAARRTKELQASRARH